MTHMEELANRLVNQWVNENIVFVCGDWAYDATHYKTAADVREFSDGEIMRGIADQLQQRSLYECNDRGLIQGDKLGLLTYRVGVLKPRVENKILSVVR